jgi:hypothetical protein
MINVYCGILMPSWGLYPRELYTNKLKNPRERPIDKGRYAEMSDIMRNESHFIYGTLWRSHKGKIFSLMLEIYFLYDNL